MFSLEEALSLIAPKVTPEKLMEIRDSILDTADLEDLGLGHRRLIESHYKIIYRVVGEYIYITDIFDSRQDPDKMKG